MSDDAKKFFEDEDGRHILIPEGQTVEKVVDDIHEAETPKQLPDEYEEKVLGDLVNSSVVPDGKHSDILERALEDKVTAEERETDPPQELLTVSPPESPLYSPGDLVGYAEARAGNVVIEDGMPMRMIVDLDNSKAGRSLKDLLTNDRVLALSIFEAPVDDDDADVQDDTLEGALTSLLNSFSAENESGTPDFILAEYLMSCLEAYNSAILNRAKFNGKTLDRFGRETDVPEVVYSGLPDGLVRRVEDSLNTRYSDAVAEGERIHLDVSSRFPDLPTEEQKDQYGPSTDQ